MNLSAPHLPSADGLCTSLQLDGKLEAQLPPTVWVGRLAGRLSREPKLPVIRNVESSHMHALHPAVLQHHLLAIWPCTMNSKGLLKRGPSEREMRKGLWCIMVPRSRLQMRIYAATAKAGCVANTYSKLTDPLVPSQSASVSFRAM
jgi:hypothetical protein